MSFSILLPMNCEPNYASEILHDDDDIPEDLRKQFLQNIISESDRLNRLFDKILDLDKFETGK